jgi:hypothetical protein
MRSNSWFYSIISIYFSQIITYGYYYLLLEIQEAGVFFFKLKQ